MAIDDKLNELIQIKSDIKDAIVDKGVEMPDGLPFNQYASRVSQISGGSSEDIAEALDLLNGGDATLFSTKANVEADNLTQEGKSLISSLGLPSRKYDSLTLGSSGSTYVAPANGWFYIRKKTGSSSWQWFNFVNTTNEILALMSFAQNNVGLYCLMPCLKGDVIKTEYSMSGETEAFRFYYAEGDK